MHHLALLICNPNQPVGAAPAPLELGRNLLHSAVREYGVSCRHIEHCRLKRETQDTVLIGRLPHFARKRGLKHVIDKKVSAQAQRQRHDNDGGQQHFQ